ncbi:histidine kinase [Croceibacterium mercuriale]|uniref:histidine kinase n=1 Tax=Croceibacterium mercuriale TaxID=1572751 RepID=A0A0B2BX33_9SPHN|nr:PAS domain-containing protein [Croceibacterium mercuriale]KHL26004.1 histidine kinase [Croceibacterium mercuriale]
MTLDFEALFARSPNPYVVIDPELTIVWANDAYLRVTMRDRDDILGRGMFEAFPADPASESSRLLDSSLQRVLATGQADEIAIIRYDIRRPDETMDTRYWSATHTPLLDEAGALQYILQHTVDVTELHELRRARDEAGLMRRASAVQDRNRDLAAESRRLIDFFAHAPGFVALLDGPDHRFTMANQAYRTLVGRDDLIGKSVSEALPEVMEQGFGAVLDRVRVTGEPFFGRRLPVYLQRTSTGSAAALVLNFIFQPVFGVDDQISGIIIQGYDVTEEVEYEERQAMLVAELNHRVKNTLAVVQGLAGQSFRRVAGAQEANAIFSARLKALGAAHSLLTDAHWGGTQLAETIRRSAEATAGEAISRFILEGPDIALQPQTAVSLAMIVHEMCTNAVKYGALATDEGQIAIDWSITEDAARQFTLNWRESGGPIVAPAPAAGFGTRLIRRGLSTDGTGRVEMDFAPDGLTCKITAKLGEPEPQAPMNSIPQR